MKRVSLLAVIATLFAGSILLSSCSSSSDKEDLEEIEAQLAITGTYRLEIEQGGDFADREKFHILAGVLGGNGMPAPKTNGVIDDLTGEEFGMVKDLTEAELSREKMSYSTHADGVLISLSYTVGPNDKDVNGIVRIKARIYKNDKLIGEKEAEGKEFQFAITSSDYEYGFSK